MPLMVRVSSSRTAARALFCSLARSIICCVSSESRLTKTSPSWYVALVKEGFARNETIKTGTYTLSSSKRKMAPIILCC